MKSRFIINEILALLGDPISSDIVDSHRHAADEMDGYKAFVIQSFLNMYI